MIAEAVRRSALADYKDRFAALEAASGGKLSIRELPFLSQLNLRADPNDAALMHRLATALDFALPVVPNTTASGEDHRALWLAPDEWLVVGLDGQPATLPRALRNGLDGAFGSIVDVSANRAVLEIGGERAWDLLAHGVPIDLGASSLSPGGCAQTLLAKAQVIIERPDDLPACRVYVRSSFAPYVGDWLLDAAKDPGLA